MTLIQPRPPVPPFSYDDAVQKVRMAENAWNGRDPAKVSMAYTPDTVWRNRSQFLNGRSEVEAFLTEKWAFDADGYMAQRHASINDVPISEDERKFHWDAPGPRPDDHPGLTELGL